MKQSKLTACYRISLWLGVGCCALLAALYGLLPVGFAGLRFVGCGIKAALAVAFIMLHTYNCGGKAFRFASVVLLSGGIIELAVTAGYDELRYSNLIAGACCVIAGVISFAVILRNKELGRYVESMLQGLVFFSLISLMMNLSIVNVLSHAGLICFVLLFLGVYEPGKKEAQNGL